MKAETTIGELYIEFQHVRPIYGLRDYFHPQLGSVFQNEGDAGTYCIIRRDNSRGDIVSQGRSIIHINDVHNFNKEIGRRISLKNAVRKLGLKYEDRKALFDAYFNRKNEVSEITRAIDMLTNQGYTVTKN